MSESETGGKGGFGSRAGSKKKMLILVVVIGLAIYGIWWFAIRTKGNPNAAWTNGIQQANFKLNTSQAEQSLSTYLASNPPISKQQTAIVQVGDIYVTKKEYTQAISKFLQAQALAPNSNQEYIDEGLATAYDDSGQNSEAIIYYQKSIQALNPKNMDTPDLKAQYTQRISELSK